MLDRYLLRYFLAVVDQGNFSRAAQACNVAQPTLSVGIAKLERILGQALFVRSNQRVELTDAGSRFAPLARRIEREFNSALHAMDSASQGPPLRLAVLSSIPVGPVAAAIARTRPGSDERFEIIFGTEREIMSHLAKGRIDIAFTLVSRGSDRFAERAVFREGYALALSIADPLASLEEIAPEQIAREPMIVRRHCEALAETSRFFTERGVRPYFAMRSTDDERVLHMVAAGVGLTVMPQSYAHAAVARPRVSGFDLQRTIGWAAAHGAEHLLEGHTPVLLAIEEAFAKGQGCGLTHAGREAQSARCDR